MSPQRSEGSIISRRRSASAKAPRQECVWHVQETGRPPLWQRMSDEGKEWQEVWLEIEPWARIRALGAILQ